MSVRFTNNANSLLASAITNAQTTLAVTAGDGAKFPSPTGGDWCPVTLVEGTKMEIVRCTARSGDTLTVTRAQEGTAAQAFGAGAQVDHRLTTAALQALLQDAASDGKIYGRLNGAWADVGTVYATLASPTFTGSVNVPTASAGVNNTIAASTAYVTTAISTAITSLNIGQYAPLASPTLTGDPKAPTPATADNDTSIATTAFVKAQGYGLPTYIGDTAPSSPQANQTWWESDSGGLFIYFNDGNTSQWVQIAAPGFADAPSDGSFYGRVNAGWIVGASKAYIDAADALKAPLASPALTGTPTAPTAAAATNTTQLATTAFVAAALGARTIVRTAWTGSGTWTKQAGLIALEAIVVGGGGGAAACISTAAGQASGTGGGAGAGTAIKLFSAASLPASAAVTVGGFGSNAGTNGGDSVFNGVTGVGGGGAGASQQLAAGATWSMSNPRTAGGGASGGDVNIPGSNGDQCQRCIHGNAGAWQAGGGGGSFMAPARSGNVGVTIAQPGIAGNMPGGGASGPANGPSQAITAGAAAGQGMVIITEYY